MLTIVRIPYPPPSNPATTDPSSTGTYMSVTIIDFPFSEELTVPSPLSPQRTALARTAAAVAQYPHCSRRKAKGEQAVTVGLGGRTYKRQDSVVEEIEELWDKRQ